MIQKWWRAHTQRVLIPAREQRFKEDKAVIVQKFIKGFLVKQNLGFEIGINRVR